MTTLACHTPDDNVKVIGRVVLDPVSFHAIDYGVGELTLCGEVPGVIYANVEFRSLMGMERAYCCDTCISALLWLEATAAAE